MNKYIYVFCLVTLSMLYSCMDSDTKVLRHLAVNLEFQEQFQNLPKGNVPVELINRMTGRRYIENTDVNGIAKFTVESGIYNVSSVYNLNADTVFNGRFDDIVLAKDFPNEKIDLEMAYGKLSPLIFKEIYYTGSRTPANKTYYADQFHEIYNNSSEVQYLDGLCIGVLQPSSFSPTKWRDENGNIMPLSPINFMAWRIPGSGKEYPIQPGESIIIAQDGIDHKDDPAGNPNSPVNMGDADWETYFDLSGKDTDSPSVSNLIMMWTNIATMTDWLHSTSGSAVILFRIPGDWEEFVNNSDNLMRQPGSSSSKEYLMIPKAFIYDAVECVKSETRNHKRLSNDLDAGYIFCSGTYVGESIRRKVVEVKNGRVIYQDTNNSTEDFVVQTTPTPGIHPTTVD